MVGKLKSFVKKNYYLRNFATRIRSLKLKLGGGNNRERRWRKAG